MIERWLQISCDNPDCGEADNSTESNITISEFIRRISPPWRRVGKRHACSARCADVLRGLR